MQEKIIIVGAGVMQGPAIRIAKELGFYTVAVDGSSAAPCVALADQFEQIDLKDKEGIEACAHSLLHSGGLAGIMTAGTDFSATVAWVAERLGLPGIPYESALNASDKARMRSCFKKAGLPSPEFTAITGDDTLQEPPLPFPLVIKPVDNMGGRGCRRVDTMEELREAAADAIRFSRSGRAIAEAFMEGPEFSVDAIVYHGEITICGLADRHIFFPPYFIEMGHTMPADSAPAEQAALLETFCAGVRALGLAGEHSIGAAKGDIKLTPRGPMIGEIAARLSGGYMSGWTYPYSSGVEPIRAAILAAAGRKPENLAPLKTWTSAERAFISIPGTVKAVSGTETARGRPHVQDLFFRIAQGDKVGFPQNNVSKCGNVISAASERRIAVEAAENAVRSILIRLDPHDGETAAFLAASGEGFPPDAFQLSAELRAALEKLPDSGDKANSPHFTTEDTEYHGVLVRKSSLSSVKLRVTPWLKILKSMMPQPPLIPFPEFANSGLRDYVGRTVTESLQAVREITGLSLPEISAETVKSSDNKGSFPKKGFLGKSFWAALVRGGYQGAVYYIDQWRGEH
ncbi:MAG: ATP-grasp domain-containing protein [Treponema sp.]|jgi:biotin carboxylase|nr:ATP-grasp domain-containing protein [Treponema sp.]